MGFLAGHFSRSLVWAIVVSSGKVDERERNPCEGLWPALSDHSGQESGAPNLKKQSVDQQARGSFVLKGLVELAL